MCQDSANGKVVSLVKMVLCIVCQCKQSASFVSARKAMFTLDIRRPIKGCLNRGAYSEMKTMENTKGYLLLFFVRSKSSPRHCVGFASGDDYSRLHNMFAAF
jgi:hypothetical protein